MGRLLDNINNSKDLQKLTYKEKEILANEIREYIIDIVSENGGHLASNLGVVELTLAIHSVFDLSKDKVVWDVGHQTYTHKILTGRKESLKTLRKFNGIAGFPKTSESEADCFNTGHSSTSISATLGMARARDIKKENNNVIAVIGDGALTGGMALEALNDAGSSKTNLIVILNDNNMSISKNVGGISLFLSKIRGKALYKKSNNYIKQFTKKIPYVGEKIIQAVRKVKYSIKQLIIPNMMFEDIGYTYIGPVYGHDEEKIEGVLKIAKEMEGPVLVHICTEKGKGYKPAEENPDKFHGIAPFDKDSGKVLEDSGENYSKVFGETIIKLAEENDKIVAITAAMKDGTGLKEFARKFPDRFFDVAIAEQHALTMAAGMAIDGLIPIVSIYSSFYQRAYDQLIHDICMQNLPVILCSDRAGIVGKDGETHQGIMDLSFTSIIPNLSVAAPKNFWELQEMLKLAIDLKKPIFIRYPRGGEGEFKVNGKLEYGKAEIIKKGNDITILAIGKMVERAVNVAEELEKKKIYAEVINVRFLKPFDENLILESIEKTKKVITIEDNMKNGGLYSRTVELLNGKNISVKGFGYPNTYVKHGSVEEIEKEYGLDVESIIKESGF